MSEEAVTLECGVVITLYRDPQGHSMKVLMPDSSFYFFPLTGLDNSLLYSAFGGSLARPADE